ncbi:MAG: 30S ribosomal protein S17e [Nanoarchaeota archaeon]
MGRIKTTLVKRNVHELIQRYPDKFSNDFNNNKKTVMETTDLNSKKLRNIMAGYLTRLMRTKKE